MKFVGKDLNMSRMATREEPRTFDACEETLWLWLDEVEPTRKRNAGDPHVAFDAA